MYGIGRIFAANVRQNGKDKTFNAISFISIFVIYQSLIIHSKFSCKIITSQVFYVASLGFFFLICQFNLIAELIYHLHGHLIDDLFPACEKNSTCTVGAPLVLQPYR